MSTEETVVDVASVVELVAGTNQELVIQDPVKLALVNDLTPIAVNMQTYSAYAQNISVHDQASADGARNMEKLIAADVKLVKGHDVLSGIIKGLHALHKRWKSVENTFVPDMEESRKTIRAARIKWEDEEAEKAAAEQRRIQAQADEKARKEREQQEKLERAQRKKEQDARDEEERLRKEAAETENAAERKKLEAAAERRRKEADAAALKAEMRQENADAVAAPVVSVAAPRAVGGSRHVWEGQVVNPSEFFAALSAQPMLQGYVEIKINAMVATKRNNEMFDVPGVTFKKVRK